MKRVNTFGVVGMILLNSSVAHAGLTYYANRSDFNTAEPGLPLQSFDSANLFNQPYVVFGSPLNSATSDGVFGPGDILPGLAISTLNPGLTSTALIAYGGGPVGTKSVGNNWFGDTLVLSFAPGVSAVAEDVFGNTSNGPSFAGPITEEVFDGSVSLGSKTLSEAAGGQIFFGVSSSTQPITSIQLSWGGDGDATTYVSSIAFGSPAPEPNVYFLMTAGLVTLRGIAGRRSKKILV